MTNCIDFTICVRICDDVRHKYYVKILKNGKNIDIKEQQEFRNLPGTITDCLIISDNIEIPEIIINIFKELFTKYPYDSNRFPIIQHYIKILQKCKEHLKSNYLKENIEINKLKQEIEINKLNYETKIFSLSSIHNEVKQNIVELKQDINVYIDHIKSLKYLNSQFEEKLNKIEKENEQLKLQIIETKQNNIITYYC